LRLPPAILQNRLRSSQRDFAGVRLTPVLLSNPLRRRQDQLSGFTRTLQALNPDSILQRGYARVTDAEGNPQSGKAEAARHTDLIIKFRDGSLPVHAGADGAASEKPAPKPQKPMPKPRRGTKKDGDVRQDDLFG
jgi:exodeoxyribonuclease VII large subunit